MTTPSKANDPVHSQVAIDIAQRAELDQELNSEATAKHHGAKPTPKPSVEDEAEKLK